MPPAYSEKPRLLFVDDEPMLLQGIRRMLHPMREKWYIDFCESGPQALEKVTAEKSAYDVVISDMRMPIMNGAEVLSRIAALHPGTIRLILSGHADRQMIMQSVGIAHRYLSKPCDGRKLTATLEQALGLRAMLRDEELRRSVSGTISLPSRPDLYVRLLSVIQQAESSIDDVEEIVSHDPAMAGKVLKLVNSAFFGNRGTAHNLNEAISYVGLDVLRSLALTLGLFEELKGGFGALTLSSMEALWSHSFDVAAAARSIAVAEGAEKSIVEESFIGGLLHDVGKLFVGSPTLPPLSLQPGETPVDAERRIYGGTHGEAGGYLFALWGLPSGVVEAVAFHHEPERGLPASEKDPGFTALTAVHAADALLHRKQHDAVAPFFLHPNGAYLARLGLSERLPAWEAVI